MYVGVRTHMGKMGTHTVALAPMCMCKRAVRTHSGTDGGADTCMHAQMGC